MPPKSKLLSPPFPGHLFPEHFLDEGIEEIDEWKESERDPAFVEFCAKVKHLFSAFPTDQESNEAQTQSDLVTPVLEALGWNDILREQPVGTHGRKYFIDLLLFQDSKSKKRAERDKNAYLHGLSIVEVKRYDRPLEGSFGDSNMPAMQLLRYLDTLSSYTDGRIRWGVLTNGNIWRLYCQNFNPRIDGFYEVDLARLVKDIEGNVRSLRLFWIFFRRESFMLKKGERESFLERARQGGRRFEVKVSKNLSEIVFNRLFPNLFQALSTRAVGADKNELREAALIFLYRLLFILYAEDRNLLPVNEEGYREYSLRRRVRDHVANCIDRKQAFSDTASSYYNILFEIFNMINKGDASIGLPPYNGKLFSEDIAPLLNEVKLSDQALAPIIDNLGRRDYDGERVFVNYRSLSVQQLGAIYEQLLEYEIAGEGESSYVRPNAYARRGSGSYYTPQELVDLIMENTIGVLVKERLDRFCEKSEELAKSELRKEKRLEQLQQFDPAEAVLNLKVLDPAMGSGHFLVTAADYLAGQILRLVDHASSFPEWIEDGEYESPVMKHILRLREKVLKRSQDNGWKIDENDLSQKQIVRRMVLKRCIYGVDKNPMAVELSKLSLWLHSFTVGAPLSFLDHHIRCGDSLFGQRVKESLHDERLKYAQMFINPFIKKAEEAIPRMEIVENLMDADIKEVQSSANHYEGVKEQTNLLHKLMDFLHGLKWCRPANQKEDIAIKGFFDGKMGSVEDILSYGSVMVKKSDINEVQSPRDIENERNFSRMYDKIRNLCEEEKFFHWEIEFPGVWKNWLDEESQGGFDVVIGNPPWDRIKVQEVEWFAARNREIASQLRAIDRKRMIQQLRSEEAPLVKEYDRVCERIDMRSWVVRKEGDYPLMGQGDINIYSLFVERARMLAKSSGIIGLLTPSGIYGDKTAAPFFRKISIGGFLSKLFDFENRKIFFPDVHSSFKFCAIIFGGVGRMFKEAVCAFFLHDVKTADDSDRCFRLTPDDFSRVNPNTGTAPVFFTHRDAEIIKNIYVKYPVLVNYSGEKSSGYPIKYMRMFDMTNDSELFMGEEALEEDGFYNIANEHRKKGEEIYVPLYVGRMISHFDHRAASVIVNPDNVHHATLSEETTPEQHADISFTPTPQYWVPESEIKLYKSAKWVVGFRSIARPTDIRTLITSIVPRSGYGNSLPVLLPIEPKFPARGQRSESEYEAIVKIWKKERAAAWKAYNSWSVLLYGNLTSVCLDYVVRRKIQGSNLNLYILEQLPVIPQKNYERRFGKKTAEEIVRDHVLRLIYTSHDMDGFAYDVGYKGEPFRWNEEKRRHLRARLDALYFLLYDVSREDAEYIFSTFHGMKKQDKKNHNRYLTCDLVLAYMNALEAGDSDTIVSI